METNTCKVCERELPEDKFMRTPIGYSNICKECVRAKKARTRDKKKAVIDSIRSIEDAKRQRLSEFTPRELLAELKARGYKWQKMQVTITKEIDYNKI